MISIRTCNDMARALASSNDADLNRLLIERRDQLVDFDGCDIVDLAHIIIAEPGDTLASIEGEARVPLATNLADGSCWSQSDFSDNFEWVERHGVWIEAVMILSDDGFGVVLLVPDRLGIDADLLRLVRDRP